MSTNRTTAGTKEVIISATQIPLSLAFYINIYIYIYIYNIIFMQNKKEQKKIEINKLVLNKFLMSNYHENKIV